MAEALSFTSGLPAAGLVAVRSVGFEPLGQVTGLTVLSRGWRAQTRLPCSTDADLSSHARALGKSTREVFKALVRRCSALGGDGVVGVTVTTRAFGDGAAVEHIATGTVLRSRTGIRNHRPFLAHIGGQDFAKLILSGWVPVDMVPGTAMKVIHKYSVNPRKGGELGWMATAMASLWREAHGQVTDAVRQGGGQGFVLAERSRRIREQECLQVEDREDYVVVATLMGTSIIPFHADPAPPRTLTIMRLT
ncbi:heavy metal-binding domain-containing protein [Nonomuraea pusilla]|uniref:Putative heavy-metal-binding n=1 Tax=Nonomuraea pusilla TaxID=46177 RepID=A0A1H7TEK6_9ACTN|nr:heavy metal-binding domain-containing protein [Nonomuraea pusilla]SEL82949.1 Putative heavy-metal-binding [Nonomuraea pusilla]